MCAIYSYLEYLEKSLDFPNAIALHLSGVSTKVKVISLFSKFVAFDKTLFIFIRGNLILKYMQLKFIAIGIRDLCTSSLDAKPVLGCRSLQ
jgi:hypothetical protein